MAAKPRTAPRPEGAAPKTRARGEELEARLDMVEELITRACGYREIRAACAKEWGIAWRQADEYVTKVYERWRNERHGTREAARERQRRRCLRMVRKADAAGDIRAAARFEDLLMRLEGTEYQPADDLSGGAGDHVEIVDPPEEVES